MMEHRLNENEETREFDYTDFYQMYQDEMDGIVPCTAQEMGREATVEELAARMKMTEEEIKDIMKLTLDAMSVSGEKRAFETASCVAEQKGLPVVSLDGLREVDFGLWEGMT